MGKHQSKTGNRAPAGYKYCSNPNCPQKGVLLEVNKKNFRRQKSNRSGYSSWCLLCTRKASRDWNRRHPDRIKKACLAWRKRNPERARMLKSAAQRRYRAQYPERDAAHKVVEAAIKKGKMARQPCVLTGKEGHVIAHHYDYFKPLNVVWLHESIHPLAHKGIIQITETLDPGVVLITLRDPLEGVNIAPGEELVVDTNIEKDDSLVA